MIAVILPSRGLIFSKTAEEIVRNLRGIPHQIYFAHRRPLPECFNEPLEKALKNKEVTHIWFVEDDMVLPDYLLQRMLDWDKAVVTCDYPINDKKRGSVLTIEGQTVITGTGCLLVKREVFDELKKPYFRTDIRWTPKNYGQYIKFIGRKVTDTDGYGLHDVNFSMNLNLRGIPIHVMEDVLGQRKLISLGKAGSNDGAHNIETWTEVDKDQLLKQIKSWPVNKAGKLVTVDTPTGEVLVSATHAKKLVKAGLATYPPKKAFVIDDSEVL